MASVEELSKLSLGQLKDLASKYAVKVADTDNKKELAESISPFVTPEQVAEYTNPVASPENGTERSPSFGEKAMGVSFNPSGDPKVTKLKALYAEIADILNDDRGTERDERARLASVAITEAQTAQMWAVKAVTYER